MDKQTKQIIDDMKCLAGIFNEVLTKILPSFKITDKKVLPYGLKSHTRSISWLVEQVIIQQTKYHRRVLKIDEVFFDLPDTCLHDREIKKGDKIYYVNVKIHNTAKKENKNDISAIEKIYMQYTANPDYNLIYTCFGIEFENVKIKFDPDYLVLFSPQFMPIYINPRNDKLQAYYHHKPDYRRRKQFLELLRKNSKSIIL